jgi:N-acetylglucosaminyldiphosphoundecaprenol N-acetyl-beta-D-mannosaminyltransferase
MYQEKVSILNVDIDNISRDELLRKLTLDGGVVYTPNVDHLVRLQKDFEFSIAYNMATYRVCDSQVIMYASKFLGTPLQEKICGSDLFPAFYNYNQNNPEVTIFLLGGREGIPQKAQANVLAIGVGTPKQEKWIYKYRSRLKNIKVILAVGATVDFEAGNIPRAPKWISNLGLEWLYRLVREPKRLAKRYLVDDLPFLGLILKQKLQSIEDNRRRESETIS